MKRGRADLHALQDEATLLAIKYQEDAGVDIVSDGEQRRDNFYSFICHRLDGIRLMTMADLLEYVEDKAAFETLLNALDAGLCHQEPDGGRQAGAKGTARPGGFQVLAGAYAQGGEGDAAGAVSPQSFHLGEEPLRHGISDP